MKKETKFNDCMVLFPRQLFDFHVDLLFNIKLSKCQCTSYSVPEVSVICDLEFRETQMRFKYVLFKNLKLHINDILYNETLWIFTIYSK